MSIPSPSPAQARVPGRMSAAARLALALTIAVVVLDGAFWAWLFIVRNADAAYAVALLPFIAALSLAGIVAGIMALVRRNVTAGVVAIAVCVMGNPALWLALVSIQ